MAIIEVLILTLQWCVPACKPFRGWYFPLGMSILVVETLEAVTWPYVEPLKSRLDGSPECPVVNQVAVTLQGINIMWQGLWFLLPSMRAGTEQKYFRELRLLMILGGIFGVMRTLQFILTYLMPNEARVDFRIVGQGAERQPAAVIGYAYHISCAYLGPHGHQLWQWAQSTFMFEFFPSPFFYFCIIFLGFFLFEDKIEALNMYLFAMLYVIFFLLWGNEAGSMWCWTGIELDLFYLIYPVLKDRFGWNGIATWQGLFLQASESQGYKQVTGNRELVAEALLHERPGA